MLLFDLVTVRRVDAKGYDAKVTTLNLLRKLPR